MKGKQHKKRSYQEPVRPKPINNKSKSINAAIAKYHQQKKDKEDRKRELLQKSAEMRQALLTYTQKKKEKNKKLRPKTAKGQPIMKNRIEMLLEKIQRS